MSPQPIQKSFPWVLFVLGLILFALASWPLPAEKIEWTADAGVAAYTFQLSWPTSVRVGENREANLVIIRKDSGQAGQPEVLRVRLEFNDLIIDPSGMITQIAAAGRENKVRWSITAGQPGLSTGTLWIYTSASAGGEEFSALAARTLNLRSFGPTRSAILFLRWLGVALAVLGAVWLSRLSRR